MPVSISQNQTMPFTRGERKRKETEVREQKKKKQKAAAARAERKASSSSSPLGSNSSSNSQNTTPPLINYVEEQLETVEEQLEANSGISDLMDCIYNEEKNHYSEHVSDYFQENPELLKDWVQNLAEHELNPRLKTYANQDPELVLHIIDFNTVLTKLLPTKDHVYYSLRVLLDLAWTWTTKRKHAEIEARIRMAKKMADEACRD